MQEIKRMLTQKELRLVKIKYFGYNSNGVFTICLEDDTILNLDKAEVMSLRAFIAKIE